MSCGTRIAYFIRSNSMFPGRFSIGLWISTKPITGFAPAAERALLAYGWPGNIRELENLVERAVIFCRGTLIETVELPTAAVSAVPSSLTDVERAAVVKALA